MVINLAVADEDERAVLVEDGLIPALYIYDAEPAEPEPDIAFRKIPARVGAAMPQGIGHPDERLSLDPALTAQVYEAGNPAHKFLRCFIVRTLILQPASMSALKSSSIRASPSTRPARASKSASGFSATASSRVR